MKEKKVLSAVLEGKCPRCREGAVFTHRPWQLTKFNSMYDTCPNCGLKYEVEPGFFFGAMYVSYAVSVAVFLGTVFALYFFFGDPPLLTYIISVTVVSLIFYPLNFRYSRLIFLFTFSGVKYQPQSSV